MGNDYCSSVSRSIQYPHIPSGPNRTRIHDRKGRGSDDSGHCSAKPPSLRVIGIVTGKLTNSENYNVPRPKCFFLGHVLKDERSSTPTDNEQEEGFAVLQELTDL